MAHHIWSKQKKRQTYTTQKQQSLWETMEHLPGQDMAIFSITSSDMAVIPVIHKIPFRMTQSIQKWFQVTSERKDIIRKKTLI